MQAIQLRLHSFHAELEAAQRDQLSEQLSEQLINFCEVLSRAVSVAKEYYITRTSWALFRSDVAKRILSCDNQLKDSLNDFIAIILPRPILDVSLDHLQSSGSVVDLSASGTPQRYRLIDCAEMVNRKLLKVYEFVDFPMVKYCAASYIWRGNPAGNTPMDSFFSVRGAENADPIGMQVLYDASEAALLRGVTYLWLDLLCILQTNHEDKQWQIRVMYQMYKSCHLCIVIPGGLQRLVALDEETQWIHRCWTLQEALAPPVVLILFAWKLGNAVAVAGEDSRGRIEQVTPLRSAMAPLSLILDACIAGSISIELESEQTSVMVQIRIFSSHAPNSTYTSVPFRRPPCKVMSPIVSALAIAMSDVVDTDIKNYAIWQSALMRTSSRPVDIVFSIMGLFGVSLDPHEFEQSDRIGATVALIRKIVDSGGRITWLGVSCLSSPCPQLSTFPMFPRTRVCGKGLSRVPGGAQEVSQLMLNEYPNTVVLIPAPQSSIDDEGYAMFTANLIPVYQLPSGTSCNLTPTQPYDSVINPSQLRAVDGSHWTIQSDAAKPNALETAPRSFAVLVGFLIRHYPSASPSGDSHNVRAMLIQEHPIHPKKYYVTVVCNSTRHAPREID
ncbi:hypothetical protein FRC11_008518 [Ceratobasidium sp. 423]|nr:hypothetical protein FRC11_008518 [Ceratobasidium sp. 423]